MKVIKCINCGHTDKDVDYTPNMSTPLCKACGSYRLCRIEDKEWDKPVRLIKEKDNGQTYVAHRSDYCCLRSGIIDDLSYVRIGRTTTLGCIRSMLHLGHGLWCSWNDSPGGGYVMDFYTKFMFGCYILTLVIYFVKMNVAKYPYTSENTLGTDIVAVLITAGCALWTGCLIF